MKDENPIPTIGYYSKPSHEGYRNTIELPEGNNVVPLRSNTIRLVQNELDYAVGGRLQKISAEKACFTIEELARYENKGWKEPVFPEEERIDYKNPNIELLLGFMKCKVDMLMKNAILLIGRSEDVCGISSKMMHQLPAEPSCQEAFEDLVMNFILNQAEKDKQLEEYMSVIGRDFMQLSSEVVEKLKEEIRVKKNKFAKIKKIMSPQSSLQVLPSFKVYTSPVTYSEDIEETLGTPVEVEPLDQTKLQDVGLNNHNIPISYKKVPLFDEPEPQPQPLPNCPSLDVSLGYERGPKPPIKSHGMDSLGLKVVDQLTIHIPPSPHVAYYHPGLGDPKKHYGFKPGLLGQSGSLCVNLLKLEMIKDDWELGFKEVSSLGRRLSSLIRPKEVEKVIFDKKKLGSS
ncbi:hypothetical protein Tco_0267704 [Tanacetum coccineum]